MLLQSPLLRFTLLLIAFLPLLLSAQADKGMSLLSKGNPAAAEAAFRADLDNPKEAPLAMYGLSLVFADARFERRQIDTAFVFIENCDKAYRKMPPELKSKIVKQLTSAMIADQRKAVIDKAFARAKELATVQGYEFFLENFPKPLTKLKRAALAERNSLALQQAKASGKSSEVQAVLDRYGSSMATDSPNLLAEAQRALFQFFINEKGWNAFAEFKSAYPDNIVSKDTLQPRFQQALDAPDAAALDGFTEKYPGSVFLPLATDSLAARLAQSGTSAACKKFLSKYPQHPQLQAIWKRMYDQVRSNSTSPAVLERFLTDNPKYPFPEEVQSDIAFLRANQTRLESEAFLTQSEPEPGFRFLRSHPQSEFSAGVQNHLSSILLRRDATQSATAKYIKDFIELCPQHSSVNPLWKNLYAGVHKTATDPLLLEQFLQDNPGYPFKDQVLADIQFLRKNEEKLKYEAFLQKPDISAGLDFLNRFPQGAYRETVSKRLGELLLQPQAKKQDIERFLKAFPASDKRQALLKQMYESISKNLNVNEIKTFQAVWPDFEDNKRVAADLERAQLTGQMPVVYSPDKKELFDKYIRQTAPSDKALEALKKMIRTDFDAGKFTEAYQTVLGYDKAFGTANEGYNQLKSLLNIPTQDIQRQGFASTINTNGEEYAPILSADGRSLYLCKNSAGSEDIYVSEMNEQGNWSAPLPVAGWNTPNGSEAPESISADGNTFYMFKAGKFYTSKKSASGWSAPVSMPDPFNTFRWQADLSISGDGKAILFAAASSSYGNQDIYVCLQQEDGSWSEPVSLGEDINTLRSDRSPFIHPDGKTLYFSSEGHDGFGSSDIYIAKRLDDSWTRWSKPLNLGPAFNTRGNDWGFRVSTDGSFAYYSANLNGNADIVRCLLPKEISPDKVATISGKVTDTKDVPLDAEILWEDLSTGKVVQTTRSNPATGEFFAVLPERKRYGYTARKPGYFPQSGNVDMRTELSEVRLPEPIRLATIENMKAEDISLPLNNLFFETAKYELQSESFSELNRLAELLQSEGLSIEVHGHTDNVGNDAGNLILSENRAKSVRTYLISRGCNAGKITAKGFGKTKPKATNETEAGRALNRRVEIRMVR